MNDYKTKEKFFSYLFWLIFFLLLVTTFIYFYQSNKFKKNIYKGELLYYYNEKSGNWEAFYVIKGKEYVIPFYSHPKEFENYKIFGEVVNSKPRYIFLVYNNNSNYSIISASFFNLARILNPKGYYSFVYLYPAVLKESNKILVLTRNSTLTTGFIDCNMKEALFIIINETSSKNYILLNNSCIFLNGYKESVLKGVDRLTLFLLKYLKNKD